MCIICTGTELDSARKYYSCIVIVVSCTLQLHSFAGVSRKRKLEEGHTGEQCSVVSSSSSFKA